MDGAGPTCCRFSSGRKRTSGASDHHGGHGPLHVSDTAISHPSADDFIAAAEKSGIHRSADPNAPPYEGSPIGNTRSATGAAIRPMTRSSNLCVIVAPDRAHGCARDARRSRSRTCHRHRSAGSRRAAANRCRARSDPVERRTCFAAIADAIRYRRRRGPASPRDRRGDRLARWGATCRIIGSARLHGMSRRTARITTGCAGYASIWKACDMC